MKVVISSEDFMQIIYGMGQAAGYLGIIHKPAAQDIAKKCDEIHEIVKRVEYVEG